MSRGKSSTHILFIINTQAFQTQNETIFKPNTGGKLKDNLTGSAGFPTFVTEVGLYDEAQDLIGIGRISQAIPKSKKLPMRFYVRMDY